MSGTFIHANLYADTRFRLRLSYKPYLANSIFNHDFLDQRTGSHLNTFEVHFSIMLLVTGTFEVHL
jgi:hypothetical protein